MMTDASEIFSAFVLRICDEQQRRHAVCTSCNALRPAYKVSKHWKRTCIHGVIWRHCAGGSIWWLSQVRFIDLQLGCKLDFCMHLSHVVNVAL
ncbi:uncharacterized protein LOC142557128 isoform X3 [Dermacentor variabilis]|uniref:uncharacterized protein LOC142557128 isoform X3 n=1 Tax=Dermacentor variabilis TaxID=34621 RepID=UPI003F5BA073